MSTVSELTPAPGSEEARRATEDPGERGPERPPDPDVDGEAFFFTLEKFFESTQQTFFGWNKSLQPFLQRLGLVCLRGGRRPESSSSESPRLDLPR